MKHPRYEIHSISGYDNLGPPDGQRLSTTYWVADTWNCYREVELWAINKEHADAPCGQFTTGRLSQAKRNCERLNLEHDEWLASA